MNFFYRGLSSSISWINISIATRSSSPKSMAFAGHVSIVIIDFHICSIRYSKLIISARLQVGLQGCLPIQLSLMSSISSSHSCMISHISYTQGTGLKVGRWVGCIVGE
eukprot:UN03302